MEKQRVYRVLESGLTPGGTEAWAVFFGLLVSLACTGGLGAGLYYMARREDVGPLGLGVAVVASWVIGYFAGRLVADQVGIADGAFEAASDAQQSLTRRGMADEFLAMGCLVLGAQFLFGNLYRAANYFLTGPSNRQLVVATGVMTAILEARVAVRRQDVTQQLVDAGATVSEVNQAIAALQERGYLEGENQLEVSPQRRDDFA